MSTSSSTSLASSPLAPLVEVHQQLGALTRQLHDSLNGLGLTEKVKDWAGELPDAKSRLSYIARLTGEAAEKVLNQVDQAKAEHDGIASEARRMAGLLAQDPSTAVPRAEVLQFIQIVEQAGRRQHLGQGGQQPRLVHPREIPFRNAEIRRIGHLRGRPTYEGGGKNGSSTAHSPSVKSVGNANPVRAYCARVVSVHIADLRKFSQKPLNQ